MRKQNKLFLGAIIVLAIFLRMWTLTENPPHLNWDEVSHGYNAYSILSTGKDEWGKPWPTIFRAYGDFKLPVYIYLTALSEKFFGLSEFAVRFPSAMVGVLTIIALYFFITKLFDEKTGLLAALILTVSPWHILLSRPAIEGNLALCFTVFGAWAIILSRNKPFFLVLAAAFFGLSLHTYNSARVFVPLMAVFLGIVFGKELKERLKPFLISAVVFLFFFLPVIFQMVSSEGVARYKWVNIIDQGVVNRIEEERTISSLPGPLTVLLHNRPLYFAKTFIKNYFSHFSPDFLFFRGGSHYQFSIPGRELIYPVAMPFVIIGLLSLLGMAFKKDKKAATILFWLILAPVPSALTREAPHALRSFFMVIPVAIIIARGIVVVLKSIPEGNLALRRGIAVAVLVSLFLSLANFWRIYTTDYRRDFSFAWQYGYREAAEYLKKRMDSYEKVVFTKKYGEPHEFMLFYLKYPPEKYHEESDKRTNFHADWYWVDGFGKFEFVNDWDMPLKTKNLLTEGKKTLVFTSPNNYTTGGVKLGTINFLNETPAFDIVEYK